MCVRVNIDISLEIIYSLMFMIFQRVKEVHRKLLEDIDILSPSHIVQWL